jgi:endonuclease YncB( thermonuclease family)
MRNKIFLILLCAFLSPALGFAAELCTLENIQKVISGDTFLLKSGKKVRLIGVDAPENEINAKAKQDSERTGQTLEDIVSKGQEATEWVKTNLEGKNVFLKYDQKRNDDQKAEWVYAFLYDEAKFYEGINEKETVKDVKFEWWQAPGPVVCTFLNATIIRAGYATPVQDPPNLKYADLFEEAYQKARKKFEGLWNTDYFGAPCKKEGEKIGDCVGCIVKCCKGLEPMFDQVIDGECRESPAPGSGGYCSNCGNNVCESEHLEDNCSCPRDCS